MKLLVMTQACMSGVHCESCRNLEGGRALRQGWGKSFELPPAEAGQAAEDFTCPKGKVWGWQPIKKIEQGKAVKVTAQPRPATDKKKGCGCGRAKKG